MPHSTPKSASTVRRLIPKPRVIDDVESFLGRHVHIHPNTLSFAKVVVAAVLIGAVVVSDAAFTPVVAMVLFVVHVTLDALDGIVARHHQTTTTLGRFLDRLTDLPMLLGVGLLAGDVVPLTLVAARLVVDLSILYFAVRRGAGTENRPRTVLNGALVLVLLLFVTGAMTAVTAASLATALTTLSIVFGAVVVLHQIGVVSKRRIADALSFANLVCGALVVAATINGAPEAAVFLLVIGALCDGLDGAAARRFGGSRYGFLVDDVADAVTYGIAPGVALAWTVGGAAGTVLGCAYAFFTLARLVYFTLQKDNADPGVFGGAPSTVGGIMVLSALALFPGSDVLVGATVGAAMILMVSFDTRHRHLGRALLASNQKGRIVVLVLAVVTGLLVLDPTILVAAMLTTALVFSLLPSITHLATSFPQTVRHRD